MTYIDDWLSHYIYARNGLLYADEVRKVAKELAWQKAQGDLPDAVIRSEQELQRVAARRFEYWEGNLKNPYLTSSREEERKRGEEDAKAWQHLREEAWQVFLAAFVSKYFEAVGVTPTPQPATPANTAMLQGATITFKDIKRTPDEDLYIIELIDPGHLDEPQLLYVHVGDGEPQQAASPGQSFAASSYSSDALTALPSQPSDSTTGTGKVQHIYLKRKK